MDEDVLRRIVRRDEAEALIRLEPFDGSHHFFFGSGAGRRAVRLIRRSSKRGGRRGRAGAQHLDDAHDLRTLWPLPDLANQFGLIADFLEPGAVKHRNMKKRVRSPIDGRNETETLCGVEPLEARPDGETTVSIKFVTKPRQTKTLSL